MLWFNLLFDWRRGQSENTRPLALWILGVIFKEVEVTHDHIIQVLLISVVALINNEQRDLLHLDKPMQK